MSKPQGDHVDWSDKMVFSTGEAAQVCKVSQQTVIRCFDDGRLQGFRVPGSKFRRIPRDALIRFMRHYNIPVGRIESRLRRVVCVVNQGCDLAGLADAAGPDDLLDIAVASSGFEAGWLCRDLGPHAVVLGPGASAELLVAVASCYEDGKTRVPLIVHVGEGDWGGIAPALHIETLGSLDEVVRGLVGLFSEAEAGEHG